ncbi:DUF3618 domain-containing protein [Propionibacterium freudenreichii]|nr:DUF3618 domain-containing protein [Propionibacterium freudenreichii]MCT2994330.1 DUF3618 domain-containing protein [Propionibacterium freudenreichii]
MRRGRTTARCCHRRREVRIQGPGHRGQASTCSQIRTPAKSTPHCTVATLSRGCGVKDTVICNSLGRTEKAVARDSCACGGYRHRLEDAVAQPETNIDRIRERIAASRDDLTYGIETLISTVHPTALKNRAIDEGKEFASEKADEAKSAFIDENGPRWDRIGTVALAAAGVVVLAISVRGLGRVIRGK